jgi:kynurenine formamidase
MPRLEELLAPDRLVDLTQPLGQATVLWPGSRPFVAVTTVNYDTHDAYARDLELPEHAGTHADAPAHFAREGATIDEIPLERLVRPAVRLDVRDRVGENAAYAVTTEDVLRIERREGRIPAGSAVLVHTGWERYVGDPARYGAASDPPAFPGLGIDAVRLLVERGVAGIGIDTLGVEPGGATDFGVHRITASAGLWHVEGLVGLERVPARGAWLVVAVVPVVGGSGAPARAFAVLPG